MLFVVNIPLFVGNIGIMEFAYTLVLGAFGVSPQAALSAAHLMRLKMVLAAARWWRRVHGFRGSVAERQRRPCRDPRDDAVNLTDVARSRRALWRVGLLLARAPRPLGPLRIALAAERSRLMPVNREFSLNDCSVLLNER